MIPSLAFAEPTSAEKQAEAQSALASLNAMQDLSLIHIYRRIFPAIDPVASGTRKEELLLDPQEAPLIWAVRRILSNTNSTERAMDMLIKSLKQTNSCLLYTSTRRT